MVFDFDTLPPNVRDSVKTHLAEGRSVEVQHEGKRLRIHPSGEILGLGDVISKVTSAIGIKPCGGCGRRRELLNAKFPFKKGS